jgi:hypothetical protein
MRPTAFDYGVALGTSLLIVANVYAAEGGYSNYIPGTYGDFAMAVEPEADLTLRNDVYAYFADGDGSVRSGVIEAAAEFNLLANLSSRASLSTGEHRRRRGRCPLMAQAV